MESGDAWSELAPHTCYLFSDPQRRAEVLARFLAQGLTSGEQCRAVAYTRSPDRAMGALAAAGFALGREMERGALDVLPARGTPLVEPRFDVRAATDWVEGLVESARAQGFLGLRLALDMSWALSSAVRPESVLGFESGLNELTVRRPLRVLCTYDAAAFGEDLLPRVRVFHGQVLSDGPEARPDGVAPV